MKISFIIPFYNTYEYTLETIESIRLLNIEHEIIIINDNMEKTPMFEGNDIIVLNNKENVGSGQSRNNGLDNISKDSTHVFFIDSDDLIASSSFLEVIRNNPDKIIDFAYSDYYINKSIPVKSDSIEGRYKNQIWGIAIPVNKICKELYWVDGENNDSAIKRRVLKKYEIIPSDVIAINYRIRKSSMIHSKFSEKRAIQEVQTIINLIGEGIFDEGKWNDAYFELYIHKNSFSKKRYSEMMNNIVKNKIDLSTKFNAYFYRVTNYWQTKHKIKSIFLNRKMFN